MITEKDTTLIVLKWPQPQWASCSSSWGRDQVENIKKVISVLDKDSIFRHAPLKFETKWMNVQLVIFEVGQVSFDIRELRGRVFSGWSLWEGSSELTDKQKQFLDSLIRKDIYLERTEAYANGFGGF